LRSLAKKRTAPLKRAWSITPGEPKLFFCGSGPNMKHMRLMEGMGGPFISKGILVLVWRV